MEMVTGVGGDDEKIKLDVITKRRKFILKRVVALVSIHSTCTSRMMVFVATRKGSKGVVDFVRVWTATNMTPKSYQKNNSMYTLIFQVVPPSIYAVPDKRSHSLLSDFCSLCSVARRSFN